MSTYLRAMHENDLPRVQSIEKQQHLWPWSEGNFKDSIKNGHWAQVLCGDEGEIMGYMVVMQGVHEVHLLNITVSPAHCGRGLARQMLDELCTWAIAHADKRADEIHWVWLEVRQSNQRAIDLYERYGFAHISIRKGYYPMEGFMRENAMVMSLKLDGVVKRVALK